MLELECFIYYHIVLFFLMCSNNRNIAECVDLPLLFMCRRLITVCVFINSS